MSSLHDRFYDRNDVYEREIKPLVDQIIYKCNANRIPMFITACVKNTPDASEYVSDGVFPTTRGMQLTNDRITKHLAVVRDFDVVPKREEVEINMSDEISDPASDGDLMELIFD